MLNSFCKNNILISFSSFQVTCKCHMLMKLQKKNKNHGLETDQEMEHAFLTSSEALDTTDHNNCTLTWLNLVSKLKCLNTDETLIYKISRQLIIFNGFHSKQRSSTQWNPQESVVRPFPFICFHKISLMYAEYTSSCFCTRFITIISTNCNDAVMANFWARVLSSPAA